MDVDYDDIKTNPWEVEDLDDFLYFCCPECDEREKSKELFLQHALEQHPRSKDHHPRYLIKKEPIDYENHNNIDNTGSASSYTWNVNASSLRNNFIL